MRPAAALIAICLLVAACGHRGPLYLPGKPGDPSLGRQSRDARPNEVRTLPGPTPNDKPVLQEEAR